MTTAPDMLYHLGGVPVGGLPFFKTYTSKVYYVDTVNGSDNNSGESIREAKATIAAAVTLVNNRISWSDSPWGRRDIIIILPGTYAENLTSLPYGAVMYGVGLDNRDAQSGVKVKPASGDPVDVGSCINTEFYNIGFESPGTGAAFDADICNNSYFYNCFFTGAAEATTAVYAFYTTDATKLTLDNCWFCNADNGIYFNYTNANDKAAYVNIKDCIITGCSATGIYTHKNLVGPHSVVRGTHISGSGQTCLIGIDDNAGILDVSWTTTESSTGFSGCRSVNGSYANGSLIG